MNAERTITIGFLVWLFVNWLVALRELRHRDSLIIDMRLKQDVADVERGAEYYENDLMLTDQEIRRANDVLDSWRRE